MDETTAVTDTAVRYAKSGDLRIAYTVEGSGPIDLLLVSGWLTPPETYRKDLRPGHFLSRLAAFSRLIRFDRRGTGMSDAVVRQPSPEQRLDDLRAVMEGAGSERAVLFGHSEGTTLALLFAALHPDRVSGLALYGASARQVWAPGVARALGTANALVDLRDVLPTVAAPALVLHRAGDRDPPVAEGREVAARLQSAKFVELAGDEPVPWFDAERMLDEIEEFVTGVRSSSLEARVVATVLFTDLVASTEIIRRVGDRAWNQLVAEHNLAVRRELARYGAEEINTTGDGFFAIFEAPSRAVRCAMDIRRDLNELGLQMRGGIHTGEVERAGREVRGIAVHLAQRIMSSADPGDILMSGTTRELISGSGIELIDSGERSFKGIAEPKRVYALAQGAARGAG